jgi:hypothetical protein
MASPPRITISLDATERKRLERLAAENERSIAQEARLAIRFHLEASAPTPRGKR